MKKICICFSFLLLFVCPLFSQDFPAGVQKLMKTYPGFVKDYDGHFLIMQNGKKLVYSDGIVKSEDELLNRPSVADMLNQPYIKGIHIPSEGEDPGRIRNEDFMKAIYGETSLEVQNNLTTIIWCPKLIGSKIRITKVNNVHIQLQKVSEELDNHPELREYLMGATTFNWRIIKGTNRLSTHSFGTSIDLNIKFSNYWQWDCRCTNENASLKYKNRIPQEIVDIFEKHGFIWGGKWYHYDTMHFEYRPELLVP